MTRPNWILNLASRIPVSRILLLEGNTRDVYALPVGRELRMLRLQDLFAQVCLEQDAAYETVRVGPGFVEGHSAPLFEQLNAHLLDAVRDPVPRALEQIRRTVGSAKAPFSFFLDASDFLLSPQGDESFAVALLHILDRMAASAHPSVLALATMGLSTLPPSLRQPIPGVASVVVPPPDLAMRRAAARHAILERLPAKGGTRPALTPEQETALDDRADKVALAAEDMFLVDLNAVLARIPLDAGMAQAVRHHRAGIASDPWRQVSREALKELQHDLESVIFGQDAAIRTISARVKRASSIVSSARYEAGERTPRLKLILAGPSGTGKTETAKEITRLIYGDPEYMLRVDCSEYQNAESLWNLTGSPRGYVSTDEGGYLTNAMLQRPNRTVLFDDIEQATPALYKLMYQILSEGRLTDSHGRPTCWSTATILMTTNLGHAEAVAAAAAGMPPDRVRAQYVEATRRFFFEHGQAPVWMRLGASSVIPFDDLLPDVLARILDKGIARIVEGLARHCRIRLRIDDKVRGHLHRGLGSIAPNGHEVRSYVEYAFMEPLSAALADFGERDAVVEDVVLAHGEPPAFVLAPWGGDGR